MWQRVLLVFAGMVIGVAAVFVYTKTGVSEFLSPLGSRIPISIPKPLNAYTFKNLRDYKFAPSQITIGKKIDETDTYASYLFYFQVKEPGSTPGTKPQKVSGLMNVPKKAGTYPVIIMYRGYVDPKKYTFGLGTNPMARVLAQNGYITLAPDFLGYGQSDKAAADPWENRFQTYTTAATMLDSIKNINSGLKNATQTATLQIDPAKVGIWAHSNGGHIALSAVAITGVAYPTVLWAPVSKDFPYSVLYYTDEADDGGKSLRKLLSIFEEDYNVNDFDPARYYKWIKAPIQINQGLNDEEVPYWWSESLRDTLKKDGDHVTLYEYPNSDHNLSPGGWSAAVQNALQFYSEKL